MNGDPYFLLCFRGQPALPILLLPQDAGRTRRSRLVQTDLRASEFTTSGTPLPMESRAPLADYTLAPSCPAAQI